MFKLAVLSINVGYLVNYVLLTSVWKYLGVTGRTFSEMLADANRDTIADRPEYERYLTVNGLLLDTKQAEYV